MCEGATAAGRPCRAYARTGSRHCIYHDPAYYEALREAGARGGHRPRRTPTVVLSGEPIVTHHGLAQAATTLMNLLITGSLPSDQADRILRTLHLVERNL
jgi:hypothetical protein